MKDILITYTLHTIVGRTPPDEYSVRRRDLYLIIHNTHNRQISMPPVGFEPTISAGLLIYYLLTLCSKVLLEKLTEFQLVRKFPAF